MFLNDILRWLQIAVQYKHLDFGVVEERSSLFYFVSYVYLPRTSYSVY